MPDLLRRWHAGDKDALRTLLEGQMPAIRAHVHRRLGPVLRRAGDTEDFVQDATLEVLRYAPPFVVATEEHFRLLMGRIVENVLRNRHDRFTARRRDLAKECPLPSDSALELSQARSVTRPSEAAVRHEQQSWVRLALELLEPDDRDVIVLHRLDGLGFAEVAAQLGITVGAAKMRHHRAFARLAMVVGMLRAGEIEQLAELRA